MKLTITSAFLLTALISFMAHAQSTAPQTTAPAAATEQMGSPAAEPAKEVKTRKPHKKAAKHAKAKRTHKKMKKHRRKMHSNNQ